jgi:hypothetical protein
VSKPFGSFASYEIRVELSASLAGVGQATGSTSWFGSAPRVAVDHEGLAITGSDHVLDPATRWWTRLRHAFFPLPPRHQRLPLAGLDAHVRPGDALHLSDLGQRQHVACIRDGLRFAVSERPSAFGLAEPPEFRDEGFLVREADGVRLREGETFAVGGVRVHVVLVGVGRIPRRRVVLAANGPGMPDELVVGWARVLYRVEAYQAAVSRSR